MKQHQKGTSLNTYNLGEIVMLKNGRPARVVEKISKTGKKYRGFQFVKSSQIGGNMNSQANCTAHIKSMGHNLAIKQIPKSKRCPKNAIQAKINKAGMNSYSCDKAKMAAAWRQAFPNSPYQPFTVNGACPQ
jgi:hypothetical protein